MVISACFKTRLVANQESNSESVPTPFWRLWNIFGYKSAVEYQREYVGIRGVIFIIFFSLVNSNQKGSGRHSSNAGSRNTAMVEAEKSEEEGSALFSGILDTLREARNSPNPKIADAAQSAVRELSDE
jgi:hypothetical protein